MWTRINLNESFKSLAHTFTYCNKDMSSAPIQSSLLYKMNEKMNGKLNSCGDFPFNFYSGFLEDRSDIWENFEDSKKMVHLGIDINLKENTLIKSPFNAFVFHIFNDFSDKNGWGTRIILKLEKKWNECEYLLIGHLNNDENIPKIKTLVKQEDVIGSVANSNQNGGWFPHIHVQLMKKEFIELYIDNLDQIDGYYLDNQEYLSEYVRDPTDMFFYLSRGTYAINPLLIGGDEDKEKRSLEFCDKYILNKKIGCGFEKIFDYTKDGEICGLDITFFTKNCNFNYQDTANEIT